MNEERGAANVTVVKTLIVIAAMYLFGPTSVLAQPSTLGSTRLEQTIVRPNASVVSEWTALPAVRVGAVRNSGSITVRVGRVRVGSEDVIGLEVVVEVGDDKVVCYLDPDEVQPIIEVIDETLRIPMHPESKDLVHEIAYKTRGRFRVAANQRGGDEPDYRFMGFVPVGLALAPHQYAEFRSDGPAGVFVARVLRGDPNDAKNIRKLFDQARQLLTAPRK